MLGTNYKLLIAYALSLGIESAGEFGRFLRLYKAGRVVPNLTGKSTVIDLRA